MTSNEIIRYVDKKGLFAIVKNNAISNPLFYFDLNTNPKLTEIIIIKKHHIQTKLLLTKGNND
jgi:hypothetical protein